MIYGYDVDTLIRRSDARVDEILTAYESALVRQGRAEATRTKYVHGIRAFLEWADGSIVGMTTFDIDLFLSRWEASWEEQTGHRPRRATVRARICALRSF